MLVAPRQTVRSRDTRSAYLNVLMAIMRVLVRARVTLVQLLERRPVVVLRQQGQCAGGGLQGEQAQRSLRERYSEAR